MSMTLAKLRTQSRQRLQELLLKEKEEDQHMGDSIKTPAGEVTHQDFVGKVFTNVFVSEDRTTVKFISDTGECFIIRGAHGPHQSTRITDVTGHITDLIGNKILDTNVFIFQNPFGPQPCSKMVAYNFATVRGITAIQWSGEVGALPEPLVTVSIEKSEDRPLHAVPIFPESLVGKVLVDITTSTNRDAVCLTTNTLEKYIMRHKKTAEEMVYLERVIGQPESLRWSEITDVQVLVSEKFPLGHYNKNTAYFISTKNGEVVFKWEGNSDGTNVDVGIFKLVPTNDKGENAV